MSKRMSRSALVGELARLSGCTRRQSARLLRALAATAYREAVHGFTIPGICKLDVVERKSRTCRDPQSGARLLIGTRPGLRIRPVKKAKDLTTPRPDGVVRVLDINPPVAESVMADRAMPPGLPD